MKILLVNGSPNQNGCTHRMLVELQNEFKKLDVESDIFWIGKQVDGCVNCRYCKDNHINECCLGKNDTVADFINIIEKYDGLIVGSPVYYGDITGQLNNFLTRVFYSSCSLMKFIPCAGVVTGRRSGCTTAFNRLNMFFLMHSMIVVGSQYWNNGHGDRPDELENDAEALQCMRTLANNMKWVCESLNASDELPTHEKYKHTNFISREFLENKGFKDAYYDVVMNQ